MYYTSKKKSKTMTVVSFLQGQSKQYLERLLSFLSRCLGKENVYYHCHQKPNRLGRQDQPAASPGFQRISRFGTGAFADRFGGVVISLLDCFSRLYSFGRPQDLSTGFKNDRVSDLRRTDTNIKMGQAPQFNVTRKTWNSSSHFQNLSTSSAQLVLIQS